MARESFLFEICKTSCSQVEVYLSLSSSSASCFIISALFSPFFFFVGRVCSTDHYLLCQAKYASVYMEYKPDFMTPIKTRESPELGKYEEQEVHLNYV